MLRSRVSERSVKWETNVIGCVGGGGDGQQEKQIVHELLLYFFLTVHLRS